MTHAERMKEIKEREDAATPRNQLRMHRSGESEFCIDDCTKDMLPIAIFRHENAESECRFAFNARTDIPYLLSRVKELESALGEAMLTMRDDADVFNRLTAIKEGRHE